MLLLPLIKFYMYTLPISCETLPISKNLKKRSFVGEKKHDCPTLQTLNRGKRYEMFELANSSSNILRVTIHVSYKIALINRCFGIISIDINDWSRLRPELQVDAVNMKVEETTTSVNNPTS